MLLERVNPSLKANFQCTLTSGGQHAVSIFIALALSILALYVAGYLDGPGGQEVSRLNILWLGMNEHLVITVPRFM